MSRERYHRQPTSVRLSDELERRLAAAVERERARLRALGVEDVERAVSPSVLFRRALEAWLDADEHIRDDLSRGEAVLRGTTA